MKYRNFSSRNSNKLPQLVVALSVVSACAASVSACATGGDDDSTSDTSSDNGNGGAGTGGGNGSGGGSTGGSTGTSVCDADGATTEPDSKNISLIGSSMGGGTSNPLEGWDAFPASPDDLTSGAEFTFPPDWEDSPGKRYPTLLDEGAGGNDQSVRLAGTGFVTYGAGMNFALVDGSGCKDLSAYAGVKFWARGWTKTPAGQTKPTDAGEQSGKVFFRVITAGSNAKPMGDCDASVPNHSCYQPPQVAITLPGTAPDDQGTWKQFVVLFDSLKTIHAPSSMAANKDRAQFVGWFSSPADLDLEITGVEWCTADDCGTEVLE